MVYTDLPILVTRSIWVKEKKKKNFCVWGIVTRFEILSTLMISYQEIVLVCV